MPSAAATDFLDATSQSEPPVQAAASAEPRKKPSRAKVLLPVLVLLAAAGGAFSVFTGIGHETTDDAQVEGHVGSVAARVSGQVVKVVVKDNQPVNVGDVLVELDDKDYRLRVLGAQADLAAANAQYQAAETQLVLTARNVESNLAVARGGIVVAAAVANTSQASIEQAEADVEAAESRNKLALQEFERAEKLFAGSVITQAEFDRTKSNFDQQRALLAQSRARLVSARAGVSNSAGTMESARGKLLAAQTGPEQLAAAKVQVALAEARVEQVKAALALAEYNLEHTKVRAEMGGVVTRRAVEVGQLVSPERPLLALVPLDDTWIVANFKEDQLAEMKAGQSVEVKIDTYGNRMIVGHVDSIAPGTGSRFSLLPPDNASGNFTKVVQRVPVRINLEPHPDLVLRPGMSASVKVNTR